MNKNDLSSIKIGDELFHLQYGWKKVVDLVDLSPNPIKLQGLDGGFTLDGKANSYEYNPVLFLSEVRITFFPSCKLKTDEKIEVWNDMDYAVNHTVKHRYFSHFNGNGQACCFGFGEKSTDEDVAVCAWDNWKHIEVEK